jgi:hypothetical protein
MVKSMTGKTNLDVFAETLTELARQDRNILAATTDSRGSGRLTAFGQDYPIKLLRSELQSKIWSLSQPDWQPRERKCLQFLPPVF